MILDNKEQQDILLQLLNISNFRGDSIEKAYELKKAIEKAVVKEDKNNVGD